MPRSEPRIALATDAFFLEHVPPANHDERRERLAAAQAGFERSRAASLALRLPPRDASLEEVGRVHTQAFVDQVLSTRGHSGFLDPDTYHSPASVAVALRASGAALALTDALLAGTCQQGFGLWRPPGHHACSDRAMGFCLFNHVAIAAQHARQRGARRVLIVDWDVHHGNGTQQIFESDPEVLFISIHQGLPQYPQTGAAQATGQGEGRGFSVNLPFSVGADGDTYAAAFERVVLPIAEQFAPDLTLVSAGYDAHARDPLGGMSLRAEDYAWLTRRLVQTLGGPGAAKIGFFLEGGYDRQALSDSVQSSVDALFHDSSSNAELPRKALRPRHAAELADVEKVQRTFWRLS